MDLSEIMKLSQEAIAGGENMELSEVMRLSQDAIAGQCERGVNEYGLRDKKQ